MAVPAGNPVMACLVPRSGVGTARALRPSTSKQPRNCCRKTLPSASPRLVLPVWCGRVTLLVCVVSRAALRQIDATEHREASSAFGVRGFPTVKVRRLLALCAAPLP